MGTICHHEISLDGFVAGPDDSMDWAFAYGQATSLVDETDAEDRRDPRRPPLV